MLAATTRDRNDVLGYVYLRGGAMTIENLAVNAVMCGLKPNAFPVFIAAAEAIGQGWEENNVWWHAMTGNTSCVALVVSGPVADEIGMNSTGLNQAGAGNDVNNALGRSIRMIWRNIARNVQPNLDISDHTYRQIDSMIVAVAENVEATREVGWPTHSETLGFGAGSSSVTLMTVSSAGAGQLSSSTAWNAAWTATGLGGLLPMPGLSAALNFNGNYCGIITYTPAQARLIAQTYATKQALLDSRMPVTERVQNNPADPAYNAADPLGATGNRLSIRHAVIVGEDPDGSHTMLGGLHQATTFINQKVTGAALPGAEPGTKVATAPSAPQNFQVGPLVLDSATNTYSAKLTWDAPKTDGGMSIKHYEIYYLSGLYEVAFRWVQVPGGDGAREVTVTNLLPGVQYEFKIRARNEANTAVIYFSNGGELQSHYIFFDARFRIMSQAELIERVGGRGGWAVAPPVTPPGRQTKLNVNRYPQLAGQTDPGIKLYYSLPNTWTPQKLKGDLMYGPNGEIWNSLGERVDRAYTPPSP
jgi:hypothetical protein